MEQNPPVATKKACSFVRVMIFMIRKNISKTKLLLDFNMMVKRSKLVRKTLQNLMFPNRQSGSTFNNRSPNLNKSINNSHDEIFIDPAVIKALEMLTTAVASPVVAGFVKSPLVRQLRITDSPYPLSNEGDDHYSYVDEAAEKFILKFYSDLRRQN